MTDDAGDVDSPEAKRRAFLRRRGRFAVVRPPAVTVMLSVSDKTRRSTQRFTDFPGRSFLVLDRCRERICAYPSDA